MDYLIGVRVNYLLDKRKAVCYSVGDLKMGELNCKSKGCDGKMDSQGNPFICFDPKNNLPVYTNDFISIEPDGKRIKIGKSECWNATVFKCSKCGFEFLNVRNIVNYFPRRERFNFYFFRDWPCSSYKLCVSRDEFLEKIWPEFNKGKGNIENEKKY